MIYTLLRAIHYLNMKNYQHFYEQISHSWRDHPRRQHLLVLANSLIVLIMYCAYLGLLLWQPLVSHSVRAMVIDIIIPGVCFGSLSIFRRWLNAPRPYEKWAIQPLIPRDGHGESMPSRHVFSAMTIALCIWQVNLWLGLVLVLLACLLAWLRVLGGVHYPRDVVVGAVAGLICGLATIIVINY